MMKTRKQKEDVFAVINNISLFNVDNTWLYSYIKNSNKNRYIQNKSRGSLHFILTTPCPLPLHCPCFVFSLLFYSYCIHLHTYVYTYTYVSLGFFFINKSSLQVALQLVVFNLTMSWNFYLCQGIQRNLILL